jgi:outer membrane protein TolC
MQSQVNAQSPVAYDLPALLKYASENSYEMRIFNRELTYDRAKFSQQQKIFHPSINAYADYHWYFANLPEYWFPEEEGAVLSGLPSDAPYPVELGLPQNLFVGLKLHQPLFDYAFTLGSESQDLASIMEKARSRKKLEEIVMSIGTAFYEYQDLLSRKTLLDFGEERISSAIKIMEKRVDNEMASPIELEKLKYEQAKLELQRKNFESGLVFKRQQLQFLAGFPAEARLEIKTEDIFTETGIEDSIKQNAEAELLESALELNNLKSKRARGENLPKLDLVANLRWQSQSEDLNFFNSDAINNISTVGLKLNIPIYQPDKRKSVLSRIENEKIDLQKSQVLEAQKLQTERNRIQLKALVEQYQQEEKLAVFAEKLYKMEIERFDAGLIPIQEVQEAREEFNRATSQRMQTYYGLRILQLEYLKNSGYLLEFFNLSP